MFQVNQKKKNSYILEINNDENGENSNDEEYDEDQINNSKDSNYIPPDTQDASSDDD